MQPSKEEFLRSLQHHFGLWKQSLLRIVFEPTELLAIQENQQEMMAERKSSGSWAGKKSHRREKSGDSWSSSGMSAPDQLENAEELVVFSCGHQAFRRELLEIITPNAFAKLQDNTNCFAWTTEMLFHEYEKTNIECACPDCVANTLKEMVEQLTKVENARLP